MTQVERVPDRRAAEIAGITPRQLRYWAEIGLVRPSVVRNLGPRSNVRLYSLEDLVCLTVAAELREELSLQHIRRVLEKITERYKYKKPLTELRFGTRHGKIYFQHPDGEWEGEEPEGQLIVRSVIDLREIRRGIVAALKRPAELSGRTERRRGVKRSRPVFAGTRIPVSAVQSFLAADYSTEKILQEYPSLTAEDVDEARRLLAEAS
jgi:DNA-binding transcriptional MerR regulator